jgi:hypothetical protein
MGQLLTKETQIDDMFVYREYDLVDDIRDSRGNVRTSLEVLVLDRSADITSALSAYTDRNPSVDLGGFYNIILKFAFQINLTDTSIAITPVKPYSVNLDEIDLMEDVFNLHVECEDPNDKLGVTVHLGKWTGDDGEEHVSSFARLVHLRFVNCRFDSGFIASDIDKYILEFTNCEFVDVLSLTEDRQQKRGFVNTSVILKNVTFEKMRHMTIRNLTTFSMNGCTLDNPLKTLDGVESPDDIDLGDIMTFNDPSEGQAPPDIEEYSVSMSDYMSPKYSVSGCGDVNITNLLVKNFSNGLEFGDNERVTIANVNGSYGQSEQQLPTTIFIHGSDEVRVSNINFNGLAIDKCKRAYVSSVRCGANTCKNAEYAIRFDRIEELISVADVLADPETVKTGIIIALSNAKVNVSMSNFVEGETGVFLNSCNGNISVSNCSFLRNKKHAIRAATTSGRVVVLDCEIRENASTFLCVETAEFALIDSSISGKPGYENGPLRNSPDIDIRNTLKFLLRDSGVERLALNLNLCNNFEIRGSVIKDCLLTVDSSYKGLVSDTNIDVLGVDGVSEESPAIMIDTVEDCEFRSSVIKGVTPLISTVTNLILDGCAIVSGIRLYNCGSRKSRIFQCEFGDPDNASLFTRGLIFDVSKGFTVSGCVFYAKENTVVSEFNASSTIKWMSDNLPTNENQVIQVVDGDTNLNHFIIDESLKNLRPQFKINTLSIFREVLAAVSPKNYARKMGKDPDPITLEEAFSLRRNILSLVDTRDEWVPHYIQTVNKKLNTDYSDISS